MCVRPAESTGLSGRRRKAAAAGKRRRGFWPGRVSCGISGKFSQMVAFVMQKVISGKVLLLGVLVLSVPVQAALAVRNQNPFAQFVGLPGMAEAEKLAAGQQAYGLNLTLSSHSQMEATSGETLLLDGESYVGDLYGRYGFAGWELAVLVPYVSFQKGFMDGFIRDFHKTFGLPNGNRDKVDDHQLQFAYQGENSARLDKPAQGLGDIRLTAGWQIQHSATYQHAVHTTLKLPTGNSRRWLGSGGTDLAVYSSHRWLQGDWRFEAQAGLLAMQKPDILPDQRRPFAVFASAAISYQVFERWWASLQWDAHSALYKHSGLRALGAGHMLTGGLQYQGRQWQVDVALIEDISVDSAPDVGGLIGVKWFPARQ